MIPILQMKKLKCKKVRNGLILEELQLEFTGGLFSELIKTYFSFHICIRN